MTENCPVVVRYELTRHVSELLVFNAQPTGTVISRRLTRHGFGRLCAS